jgi:hypothetical protein
MIAISFRVALRESPNEGALTAQTCMPALILFTIRLVKGSLYTSSAMITKGLFFYTAYSTYFKISLKEVTLCSERRIKGF